MVIYLVTPLFIPFWSQRGEDYQMATSGAMAAREGFLWHNKISLAHFFPFKSHFPVNSLALRLRFFPSKLGKGSHDLMSYCQKRCLFIRHHYCFRAFFNQLADRCSQTERNNASGSIYVSRTVI